MNEQDKLIALAEKYLGAIGENGTVLANVLVDEAVRSGWVGLLANVVVLAVALPVAHRMFKGSAGEVQKDLLKQNDLKMIGCGMAGVLATVFAIVAFIDLTYCLSRIVAPVTHVLREIGGVL